MCTLTWRANADGLELRFNRDELTTRQPAWTPRTHSRCGRTWLAPVDPDGGGTWIGVNDAGLALALLNGYQPGDQSQLVWTSRGLLVDALLDCMSTREVEARLRATDLTKLKSFTLWAHSGGDACIARWDRSRIAVELQDRCAAPLSSSSRDPAGAQRDREALYQRLVAPSPLQPDALERFHRSHDPQVGPTSPCMHRDDAETQSHTLIRVLRSSVELHYTPAAPCRGVPTSVHRLPRVQSLATSS